MASSAFSLPKTPRNVFVSFHIAEASICIRRVSNCLPSVPADPWLRFQEGIFGLYVTW